MADVFLKPITKIPKELNQLVKNIRIDNLDIEKYKTEHLYRGSPLKIDPLLDGYHLEIGHIVHYLGYDIVVNYYKNTIGVEKK